MSHLEEDIKQQLEALEQSSSLRTLKSEQNDSIHIDLSDNDYLGLVSDAKMQADFYQNEACQLSASSSRLLAGNHSYYGKVEGLLSNQYGNSALFFNSGYHLNIGVISALSHKEDLILADKFIHASLIEGLRLSYAKVIRYKHLDYEHLETLLEKSVGQYRRVFIVSESLFSMDGDIANIQHLVDIKQKYGAYLYLDEAHAVGAYGKNGLGLAEEFGLVDKIDFLVGTMGKALASVGAFIICSETIKKILVNTCRSLIYTTALPPVNMAWTYKVLERIPKLQKERENLKQNTAFLIDYFKTHKIPFVGESHILAVVVGDNASCIALSNYLNKFGIRVQAVRPPTVPEWTSRIRLSLNSKLRSSDLEILASLIHQFLNH